jgi:hypothetical protein
VQKQLSPQKVSNKHLSEKRDFEKRNQEILRTKEQCEKMDGELAGEWNYWRREIINPTYKISFSDNILDDGTIIRGG